MLITALRHRIEDCRAALTAIDGSLERKDLPTMQLCRLAVSLDALTAELSRHAELLTQTQKTTA